MYERKNTQTHTIIKTMMKMRRCKWKAGFACVLMSACRYRAHNFLGITFALEEEVTKKNFLCVLSIRPRCKCFSFSRCWHRVVRIVRAFHDLFVMSEVGTI